MCGLLSFEKQYIAIACAIKYAADVYVDEILFKLYRRHPLPITGSTAMNIY